MGQRCSSCNVHWTKPNSRFRIQFLKKFKIENFVHIWIDLKTTPKGFFLNKKTQTGTKGSL